MREPPQAADRSSVRRANLAVLLRCLQHGPKSRTGLALEVRLPKATVSSLVAELVDLGLVSEGGIDRIGLVGRPQRLVELDGRGIRGIGVEIAGDHVHSTTMDLRGTVTAGASVPLDVRGGAVAATLDVVAQVLRDATGRVEADGVRVAGATIAAPGTVDTERGAVAWAPTIGWHDVPVLDELRQRLGPGTPALQLMNDARLTTIAEYNAVAESGIRNLVAVTGGYGLGGGVVIGGRPLDAAGQAPEVGHIPLNRDMPECVCGRRGCWETMVDLGALLRLAADEDDPVRDPSRDLELRLREVKTRADGGDARTLAALDQITAGLGLGLSVLMDLFNPNAVILGGYFAYFADYVIAPVRRVVTSRLFAPASRDFSILASSLGFAAAARGGSQVALAPVFADPAGMAPTLAQR